MGFRKMDNLCGTPAKSQRASDFVTTSACWALGLTAGLCFSDIALAQTTIEQMIVTAQKRSQDIQSVPASISAFSGEGLEGRQIKSVESVFQATPNVYFSVGPNNTPAASIRGVGPEGINGTIDPSVGVHVDGVYQPRLYSVLGLMNDLDNVEVLRGPQGTLYGRNANAGVINFNSKRPSDEFEGSATAFYGNYNHYGARGYVTGPILSDKISLRVAGVVDRHDGWGKNIYNGSTTEGDYFYGLRASLRLKPVESVVIDLIGSRSFAHNRKDRYEFEPFKSANYNIINALGGGLYSTEPHRTASGNAPEQTHDQKTGTGIITWDITPDVSLKSITGFQHTVNNVFQDVEALPFPYIVQLVNGRSSTFSQEFNLNAKVFDRIDLVLGLYYLRDHVNGGSDVNFLSGFTTPAIGGASNRYLANYLDVVAKSRAAFLDVTYSVTDDLRILAGIRRTLDGKEVYQTSYTATIGVPGNPAIACQTPTRQRDLDYHSTTGKLGLQYDITPEVMAYVQWQNGFKTGNYNSSACGQSFNPEKIRSWEGGIKSTLFDDTVSLNVSAFSYNYQDLQLTRTLGITQRVDNASKAKIKGLELESTVNLMDNLRVDIGMGLLDSKYIGYVGSLVAGGPVIDATGNSLTKAPKVTWNLGLEHTLRIGYFGDLKTRAEVYHSSRIWFTPFHEAVAKQDAYYVGNLLFTLTPDDCPYQFQAYVKNVTDKGYRVGNQISSIIGASNGQWGDPRTFGVEATVKF